LSLCLPVVAPKFSHGREPLESASKEATSFEEPALRTLLLAVRLVHDRAVFSRLPPEASNQRLFYRYFDDGKSLHEAFATGGAMILPRVGGATLCNLASLAIRLSRSPPGTTRRHQVGTNPLISAMFPHIYIYIEREVAFIGANLMTGGPASRTRP
jgi:hypothetical protein